MRLKKPKRLFFLPVVAFACASMLAMAAQADHFDGGAGAGDPSWSNPLNWSTDLVPTSGTGIQAINLPGYGVVVDNPGATANSIDVGTWGWDGSLSVSAGGTLSTVNHILIAAEVGGAGTVVNDGQINVGSTVYMRAGTGSFENNGTFTSTGLVLGEQATAASTVSNTGEMNINGWMHLSIEGSNSVFNMTDGSVDITGRLEMAEGGTGHLNLNGGTITTHELGLNGNGGYTIDITEGVLIADGDHTVGMNWMVSVGLITAYGGEGFVITEYDLILDQTKLYATQVSHGPVVVETGGFTEKKTGAQFFPVGFNYVDLRTNDVGNVFHDTFNPNRYDSATVSFNLAEIAAAGFNTVRVFTETAVGASGVALSPTDSELSPEYMQSVADFLEQAHAHGIYVVITFEGFPWTTRYAAYVDSVPNVEWMNPGYLNPGYIAAKRVYMRDFIQSLRQLAPDRLVDTVLAFDPQNECCHYLSAPPFSLSSGTVTPANGITYDLATDKVQLADDMAVYWTDQMAEEIHMQAPGVLVDANVFTYDAVWRSIGDFSLYGTPYTNSPEWQPDWRDRYPFRPEALAASGADFMDIHFYTADAADLQAEMDSIEFPLASNAWSTVGRPMIVGEFGAFKDAPLTLSEAVAWKRDEVDVFVANGFQGWLYWTYNTDIQTRLWNAKSGSGEIFDALEEGAKENYFGYPPSVDDLDGDGMPDSWEILYFGSTTAVNGGAEEDYEGDGVANRAEYLAGTHPNDSASNFAIVGGSVNGAEVQVQWSTVSGKTYQVLRSESLTEPRWGTVGVPVSGTGSPVLLTVPDVADQGFYKVRLNR